MEQKELKKLLTHVCKKSDFGYARVHEGKIYAADVSARKKQGALQLLQYLVIDAPEYAKIRERAMNVKTLELCGELDSGFPVIPEFQPIQAADETNSSVLNMDLLKDTAKYAATEDAKGALSSLYFDADNSNIVATEGTVLRVVRARGENLLVSRNSVLPVEAIPVLDAPYITDRRFRTPKTNKDATFLEVNSSDYTYYVYLYDTYPRYLELIPDPVNCTAIAASLKELRNVLALLIKLKPFATKTNSYIEIKNHIITVKDDDTGHEIAVQLNILFTPPDRLVAVNINKLIQCLKTITESLRCKSNDYGVILHYSDQKPFGQNKLNYQRGPVYWQADGNTVLWMPLLPNNYRALDLEPQTAANTTEANTTNSADTAESEGDDDFLN